MRRTVEFHAYNLKQGNRDEFHRLVSEVSFPLMLQWSVDIIDFGPSLHDENSYYLIRAYASLNERQSSQDAFYGSPDWRQGPREEIVALIESDTSVVIEMESAVVNALRKAL